MIDYAKITVKAGDGGRGAGSFVHIKGKRRGKANGGDGGGGGDVYICATLDLNTLEPYRYVKDYEAERGGNGAPNRRKGAEGQALVLRMPVGTQVKVYSSAEWGHAAKTRPFAAEPAYPRPGLGEQTVYDLTESGQKVLVAKAGEGGRGNTHLRDEFGRRPKSGEAGREGESFAVTLELKLIADVGLIGLPNAGKSTLLAALTAATPAIADYPFTTLEPNLGVMSASSEKKRIAYSDQKLNANLLDAKRSIVIADIPGLIEGASEGKGLGDLFLRHIERTKVLVHLVDISSEADPVDAYKAVRNELKKYSKELVKKKEIIVLNKIDLVNTGAKARPFASETADPRPGLNVETDRLGFYLGRFKKMRKKVFLLSAKSGEGVEGLVLQILKILV